ncbi:UNVERIFIED_CONTAM: hypothetical protein FKN15_005604 [Acipenser sinensis]
MQLPSKLQRQRTTQLWAAYRQARRRLSTGVWCAVSRGHPGRPKSLQTPGGAWPIVRRHLGTPLRQTDVLQAIGRILHFTG